MLVVAEARQRAAHPHIKEQEAEDLCHKPKERHERVDKDVLRRGNEVAQRACPSSQEQQRGNTAHVDHVGVLSHKEHGELHGAVLSVIAAGQLALSFRKIEGGAVGFRVSCHQVNEKGDKLKSAKNVPTYKAVRGLLLNDDA